MQYQPPIRHKFFAAVASCLLLALVPTAFAKSTAEQLLESSVSDYGPEYRDVEDATIAFRDGDFAESRRLLHVAKKKHPHLPPADVLQARLYLAANKTAEALDSLERAVAAERDDPEAYLLLSELALRQRQVTHAELALEKAVELLANYSRNKRRLREMQIRSHAGMATMGQLRGLTDQTIEHAKAWSVLNARNAQPHRLLARAYFEQDKYNEAYEELKKVAELDEKSPRSEVALARMYEDAGHREVAIKTMKLAAQKGANELQTRLAVAEWALAVGLSDMAQENAEAARKLDANSIEAQILTGRVARQVGNTKAAETILQEAVIRSPSNFSAANHLALTLAASEDAIKKKRGLEYAHLNFRSHSDRNSSAGREAAVTYAWLLFQHGREADAEKTIQAALKAGSISSESAYYVAKVFSQRGKSVLAAKILKPVLDMKRAFPQQDDARKLLSELTPGTANTP